MDFYVKFSSYLSVLTLILLGIC